MLGPEMKSTGEVIGMDENFPAAYFKATLATGNDFSKRGKVIVTVADPDKAVASLISEKLENAGFKLYATKGTHEYLKKEGIY